MDYSDLLASGDRDLKPTEDQNMWKPFADAMGLSPYVCKASFTCGVLREMLGSAGLCLSKKHQIGALFLALDATEMLGRCAGGFREERDRRGNLKGQARKRLTKGLEYLESIAGGPGMLGYSAEDIVGLRNFLGHGAAANATKLDFRWDEDLTRRLLSWLGQALNLLWDADEDENRINEFAKAEVHPMIALKDGRWEPVYVQDIQALLAQGTRPGDGIDHNELWRGVHAASVSNLTPTVTGGPGMTNGIIPSE